MNEKELIKLIEYTLNNKLEQDDNFIRYSFYELRVKYNLSEVEVTKFLELIKNRLFYAEYKTYITGESYTYNGKTYKVEDNEILIAIKSKK